MSAEIEALPLSPAQRRLWLVQRFDPESSAYNIAMGFRLRGPLDAGRLRRAFEIVVERHEAVRTTFEIFEGEPVQIFHASLDVPWEEIDLTAPGTGDPEAAIRAIEEEEATRPFDLTRGPLLRSRLARLGDDDHVWFLTFHHVIFDGWSQEVLLDELTWLYRELGEAGRPPAEVSAADFPELPIQYVDFATWQEEQLSGPRLDRLMELWRDELAGYPTVLRLPLDKPRPARQSFRGEVLDARLSGDAVARLEALGESEGASPFMTLLAVWMTVIHRLSGESRVLMASPTAGRTHPDAERLIGNFVNTLVFRGDASGDPDFRTYLRRVREAAVSAIAHQELMFEQVVEAVSPERHASFSALAQVALAVDSFALTERELAPGVSLEPRDHAIKSAKVDLTLMIKLRRDGPDGAHLILEYNSDLFERATAARWLGYVERTAEAVLDAPGTALSALPILGAEERERLLREWPPAPAGTDPERWESSIPAAFAERAAQAPDAVAVESPGTAMTYGELDRRSREFAARLAAAGARRGDLVALGLDRSPDLIVALLAILRAGAAYVPVDPAYPEERRRLMVDDSGARLLVGRSEGAGAASGSPGVAIVPLGGADGADGSPETAAAISDVSDVSDAAGPAGPDDRAYVIYTSGSTGRPKGVVVGHRAVLRLVVGTDFTDFGPDDAMLHMASISFDAATFEVWAPLLSGGRVALLPTDGPSPDAIRAALARHRVTRLFLTTALFNQLAERPEAIPGSLIHLLTGGEQASVEHFRDVLAARPRLKLSNVYGPTENTSLTTHHPVPDAAAAAPPLPIGRPISGNTCWVLDRALRPAPTGVDGELLVGGPGLAEGYLGRPALTAERFVPHPHPGAPGERLYRTGDLVRWLPSGRLDFRGRNDSQVKIRGFRIEPGEVESVLAAAPGVEKAIVVVRPVAGAPALVGYWVAEAGSGAGTDSVRGHLKRRLPSFMVPAALVRLDELPVAAGGKVDRDALPEPDRSDAGGAEYEAPRTPLEEEIAALWSEVLDVPRVGIHDDFFALGGHSLLATRILARLGDDFGVDVPLADLFEAPTVAGLAAALGVRLLQDDSEDVP